MCPPAVSGVVAIIIVGTFAQVRDLCVVASSAWLAVRIFGAGFLDGNRAYGAVCSAAANFGGP